MPYSLEVARNVNEQYKDDLCARSCIYNSVVFIRKYLSDSSERVDLAVFFRMPLPDDDRIGFTKLELEAIGNMIDPSVDILSILRSTIDSILANNEITRDELITQILDHLDKKGGAILAAARLLALYIFMVVRLGYVRLTSASLRELEALNKMYSKEQMEHLLQTSGITDYDIKESSHNLHMVLKRANVSYDPIEFSKPVEDWWSFLTEALRERAALEELIEALTQMQTQVRHMLHALGNSALYANIYNAHGRDTLNSIEEAIRLANESIRV